MTLWRSASAARSAEGARSRRASALEGYSSANGSAAAAQPPGRTTYTTASRDLSTYGNPLWTVKGTFAARVMRDFLKKEGH